MYKMHDLGENTSSLYASYLIVKSRRVKSLFLIVYRILAMIKLCIMLVLSKCKEILYYK